MEHFVYNDEPLVDIHKLIDDAMEKKDRRVSIFITKDTTSINVEPLIESKPRWIFKERYRGRYTPVCSECGYEYAKEETPYCPCCGEKLAKGEWPVEEEE